MKPVEAYQTSDGQLFTNESEAVKRQDDIIGEELDGLLMMYELDISRNQQFKAVMCAMKKRDQLIPVLMSLLEHLEHGRGES